MSRDEVLELTRRIRAERKGLIGRLREGSITAADVLGSDDPFVSVVKVVAVVENLPGLGKVVARRILEDMDVPGACRIRDLDSDRIRALLARIES